MTRTTRASTRASKCDLDADLVTSSNLRKTRLRTSRACNESEDENYSQSAYIIKTPPKTRRTRARSSKYSHVDEEKRKKFNTFLQDFDAQVKVNRNLIKEEGAKLLSNIKRALTVQIASLPQDIRDMTVGQYRARGGAIEVGESERIENVIENLVNNYANPKSKKFGTARKGKKSSKTKNSLTSRMKSKAGQTPLDVKKLRNLGIPAITPKFDIRKGITPGTSRRAKPGEILMSIAGSPVQTNRTKKSEIGSVLRLKSGKEFTFSKANSALKDDLDLDQSVQKDLLEVRLQIEKILKNKSSS